MLFLKNNLAFRLQIQRNTVIQLIGKILHAFNENKNTLGIFVNLSKASDAADHGILLKNLDMYCIKEKSLKWFHSYLTNRNL